MSIFTDIGAA